MESLWLDLRYGFRTLVRSPAFTIVAIGVLAIGIAGGTAIFSVVNAVLLRPLPYDDPSRLVLVRESLPKLSLQTSSVSAAEFWDYKQGNDVFSNIACFTTENLNLTGQGEAARIQVARVSASLFPLLAVPLKFGRTFTEEEDSPGGGGVVLISERLWSTRFGSEPDISGRTIRLDEKPHEIIGVMPARFQFPSTDNTVALLLASVGLYAVMSNLVAQRTREIGIRVAMGATGLDEMKLVVRQGALLTMMGVAMGLLCAFAVTRTMESMLFGIGAREPLVFVAVPLLLTGVALVACLVPARRATKVDPMVALRYE